jgi:predicted GNAT family N-acyltransferase
VSVQIRRVADDPERDAAIALRHRVFCEEQGVPETDEVDGRDGDGLHLVAVEDGEIIATCRLVFVGATVQFSRLAVAAGHRRRGIASAMLDAADAEARGAGARRMVLHAQTYAEALYISHGYRPRGGRFVEARIEHVAMEKALA